MFLLREEKREKRNEINANTVAQNAQTEGTQITLANSVNIIAKQHHTTITRPSHDHHTTITRPSHDHHTTITRPSHDHHTTITRPSHDHHTTITRPSHDHHTTITRPSHDHHTTMGLIVMHLAVRSTKPYRTLRTVINILILV